MERLQQCTKFSLRKALNYYFDLVAYLIMYSYSVSSREALALPWVQALWLLLDWGDRGDRHAGEATQNYGTWE
jgi:hypothetical protein